MLSLLAALSFVSSPGGEWPCYGNDPGGQRFSRLSQITKANVAKLQVAWTYRTGDLATDPGSPSSNFEATPIMVDGTLFVSTPFSRVLALNPDTGRLKWAFDPKIVRTKPTASQPFVSRGVSTWKDPRTGRRSIYIGAYDGRLISLNAATGRPNPGFGKDGSVDLLDGLGHIVPSEYTVTSPPAIIRGLVVVGSCILDNQRVDAPSGVVRAYDARTGALKWTWDPLGPDRKAAGDDDGPILPGAGNAWSVISADPARGLLFIPTGSPSPDFYGGLRPGSDRYADSVTAVRAGSGKTVWSFQAVHHDLWDYDVPAQPILARVKGRAAVVVMTKMGHVFVLDRATGKPLLPVRERPVPASDVPGEKAWPTQPFPVRPAPLIAPKLDVEDGWGVTPQERDFVRNKLRGLRNEGIFTPPSERGALLNPGNLGGNNWSGGSYNPLTQTLFTNTNSLASYVFLIPQDKIAAERARLPGHEIGIQLGAPYGMRREWLFGHNGIPGNPPPWGQLHAVDLRAGRRRWAAPLGVMPQLAGRPEAAQWGSPNLGGSFVTATGLVFIGASLDPTIRAFDAATGAVLWKADLPAGGQAAPMTYRSPKTGRQYVVICAGGHHGLGSKLGDSIVAFRLP